MTMADETHDLADAEAEAQAEAERSVAPPPARRRRQGVESTDQTTTESPPTQASPGAAPGAVSAVPAVTGAAGDSVSLAGTRVDALQGPDRPHPRRRAR